MMPLWAMPFMPTSIASLASCPWNLTFNQIVSMAKLLLPD
tara:strand:- start:70 stop:189 length:120 start_codon:yes stop_codon:yes gene_type:complete